MPNPITLYRHPLSGHCHRVELFLSLLGRPYATVDVDLLAGEQKAPSFLALNLFGQVPVIDDNGTVISDSNAILSYLAARYDDGRLMPRDAAGAAAVQRWFSVAAGEIARGPGMARLIKLFNAPYNYEDAVSVAGTILGRLESHLQDRAFLVADHLTAADVALYSYTARAPEGGIDLTPYPAVLAWLDRVEAHPRFVPFAKPSTAA